MCLCVSTPITTRRRRGLSCMLVMLLIPSFDRTDDATLAGRVDGTVTRLRQSGSYEVTARPASTTGGAPAGRRQINSKDTQTGGVSRKQESGRLPTPNILTVVSVRDALRRAVRPPARWAGRRPRGAPYGSCPGAPVHRRCRRDWPSAWTLLVLVGVDARGAGGGRQDECGRRECRGDLTASPPWHVHQLISF